MGLGGGEDVDDEVGWEVFEGVVRMVGVGAWVGGGGGGRVWS